MGRHPWWMDAPIPAMPTFEPVFIPDDYFRELTKGEVFADAARPLEIDMGCGDGSFLIAMAQQFPERNFLGVERLAGRVTKVAKKITAAGLENARVLRLESAYTVGWLLPAASVARLHLLCPDPWPKKKHHARRLMLIEEFQKGLLRVLEPQGEFLFKTDDAPYFEVGTEAWDGIREVEREEWPADAFFYAQTDFERQWLRQGKTMNRARWRKRPQGCA
ncbi:MAG: tRNA ((7)-)-methyltransferase [Verrucomicrobiaceae bacterium]|nr:tRNA ((7)-)-methyltransferase [Verrucomicrobiaceae bacterium]